MDRAVRLIVNPSAGAGRAARELPAVEAALRSHGVSFRVDRTTSIDHARALAREARDSGEIAAAMGGDGLTGAVAGELRGTDAVMAVLPGGRGNDLARKLGIGHDPVAAVDVLMAGKERRIDVAEAGGGSYLGILSAGFDSDVKDIANATRLPRLGHAGLPLRRAARAVALAPGAVGRGRSTAPSTASPGTRWRCRTRASSAAACGSCPTPSSTTGCSTSC